MIESLDFVGNEAFDELVDYLFGKRNMKRIVDDDGTVHTRVYIPRRRCSPNCDVSPNNVSPNRQTTKESTWRKEVRSNADIPEWTQTPAKTKEVQSNSDIPEWTQTPSKPVAKPEPKSILEMIEDGDERLERLLGDIIDKKLAERENAANKQIEDEEPAAPAKDPSVFIANRLTFLIQTLQPIVFDTSNIEATPNTMTIAVNEGKTFPKISTIDELGFITSQINASPVVIQEIEDYLKDTGYINIYCFPTTMEDKDGDEVFAVRFVVYSGDNM